MAIRYIPFLWRFQKPQPESYAVTEHPNAHLLARLRMTPADLDRSLHEQLERAGINGLAEELEERMLPERVDPPVSKAELPEPTRLDELMARHRVRRERRLK